MNFEPTKIPNFKPNDELRFNTIINDQIFFQNGRKYMFMYAAEKCKQKNLSCKNNCRNFKVLSTFNDDDIKHMQGKIEVIITSN